MNSAHKSIDVQNLSARRPAFENPDNSWDTAKDAAEDAWRERIAESRYP